MSSQYVKAIESQMCNKIAQMFASVSYTKKFFLSFPIETRNIKRQTT